MKKISFPNLSGQIEFRQFANGLRVFVLPRPHTMAVTMQAWVATGSIHEDRYLGHGLSHFLEHMLFQGSREFPGNRISERIAAFGGNLNAATSAEYTFAYFNLPPEYLKDGLTMLDSMIREPVLPEKQFASEREVILRELSMYNDSPVHNLLEKLRMTVLQRHPLRFNTGGFPDLLAQVTPEIMREYHEKRYTPGRTFYVVTGAAEPGEVFDILEKRTEKWARGSLAEPVLPQEPPCVFQRRVETVFPDPLAYYASAWQTPGTRHPDHIAVNAFADILGNGDSSRFYEELVNRRRLAQDILFYSLALASTGYSGVIAEAKPENMHELSGRAFDILRQFVRTGPTKDELDRLRNTQRADFLRSLQSNDGIAGLIAKSVLHYGSPSAIDSYLPRLNALTADDLIRVGKQYFTENAASIVEQYPEGFVKADRKSVSGQNAAVPELHTFGTGQRILFLEDHRLPLVNLVIRMPAGRFNEKKKQYGLSKLLAETLDSGCKRYDEQTFDRILEQNAIDLDIEAESASLTVSLNAPAEKMLVAVDLLSAMLSDPLFPEEAVERERENLLDEIRTSLMKPETAVKELVRKRLFGKHPSGVGREELLHTIAAVKAEDLRRFFHDICLSSPKTVIAFSGDLSWKNAEKWARKIIDSCRWNKYCPSAVSEPVFPERNCRETVSLPREQACVFTALRGVRSGTPDLEMMNLVRLDASSMASRLFDTLRNQNGLVYYAHFSLTPGYGCSGYMGFCGATKTEGIPVLEKIFKNEIRRLARHGLTRQEFENARKMMIFNLRELHQTPDTMLQLLSYTVFAGLGWEYIWNREANLLKMKYETVNRRIKELFSGAALVTAVSLPKNRQGTK